MRLGVLSGWAEPCSGIFGSGSRHTAAVALGAWSFGRPALGTSGSIDWLVTSGSQENDFDHRRTPKRPLSLEHEQEVQQVGAERGKVSLGAGSPCRSGNLMHHQCGGSLLHGSPGKGWQVSRCGTHRN